MAAVENTLWKIVGLIAGVGAAKLSRSVVDKGWAKARGGAPPRNPASRDTTWSDALQMAIASGVAVGVARMIAARGAAKAWEKTTGRLPPGVEESSG